MARNEDVYTAASGFEMILPAMQMMGAKVVETIREDELVSYRLVIPNERVVITLAIFEGDK